MSATKPRRGTTARRRRVPAEPQSGAGAEPEPGISAIAVEGFKSLLQPTEIAVKPLTLLAGSNSSGKSSIMQGPLLLKQTLEAQYDPGALLLDGPHVRFTALEQMLPRSGDKLLAKSLRFAIRISDGGMVSVRFAKRNGGGLDVQEMSWNSPDRPSVTIRPGMSPKDIVDALSSAYGNEVRWIKSFAEGWLELAVRRERCFLSWGIDGSPMANLEFAPLFYVYFQMRRYIRDIIHVPALRGNPMRTYKTTAVDLDGTFFEGTFDPYVASIIYDWQSTGDARIERLGGALKELGLTWTIEAARIDDIQVELRVGRLRQRTRGHDRDLVSIADVGFGLSQSVPVVVALLTARPGQLVYLEEPEIHLHPRAQLAMARLIADAAKRGVHVVAETHSALLLLGVQALVAEGGLSRDLVALHWFSQDPHGLTEVKSAELDDAGAPGDWPEDFDEVALAAQSRYLDAAEVRMRKR